MKRVSKQALIVVVATVFASVATAAFAQNGYNNYYGGACGPAACEATCSVPTCEPAACEPTCDVPTCGPEACEPVGCGGGYYGGISCDGGYCDPCCNLSTLIGGALNVAVTPLHWVASALTDGIYPGCGCAPAPARTPCNPCDICGGYVGGCNDCCQAPTCGANGTVDVYGDPIARSYGASTADSYPVGPYDSERYDASPSRNRSVPGVQVPSRSDGAPEALPAEAIDRVGYSIESTSRRPNFNAQAFNVRDFNVQALVGGAPRGVRQVNFADDRAVRRPVSNAIPQEVVVENVENIENMEYAPVAQDARPLNEASSVSARPVRKTYGQVRPNRTTGSRAVFPAER